MTAAPLDDKTTALLGAMRYTLTHKTSQALFDVPYDSLSLTVTDGAVTGRVATRKQDVDFAVKRLRDWFGLVEADDNHLVFVIPEHYKPFGWSDVASMPTTFDIFIEANDKDH